MTPARIELKYILTRAQTGVESRKPPGDRLRMGKSLSRWLQQNTVTGAYQAMVGLTFVALLTGIYGWFKGLSYATSVLLVLASLLVLTVGLNMVSQTIVRHRKPRTDSSNFVCPYEFAHEIADLQRHSISQWVKVLDVEVSNIDLFRSQPRLEFRFTLHNQSLYELAFKDLGGNITYQGQLIGEKLEWVGMPSAVPACTQRNVVIRLTLDSA